MIDKGGGKMMMVDKGGKSIMMGGDPNKGFKGESKKITID